MLTLLSIVFACAFNSVWAFYRILAFSFFVFNFSCNVHLVFSFNLHFYFL